MAAFRWCVKVKQRVGVLILCLVSTAVQAQILPEGFVYVDEAVPGVFVELRYRTAQNFVGRPVDGYSRARAILTQPAALAVGKVQAELKPFGLSVKILDAYRPQRAVDHFVRWASDLSDEATKAEYYPDVDKRNLFKEDYIAERSGHSRGSTVDLTLVDSGDPLKLLDMGTPFDFFAIASWPDYPGISPQQRANRLLLRTLMLKHGFRPYPKEWWHFTLNDEPYPETYFDFVVE